LTPPVIEELTQEFGVRLWKARLDDSGDLTHLLDPAERERAARFRQPRHSHRFTAARGALRLILGALTGQAPGALRFHYSETGKPSLTGGPHFNLSHSGGLAVCAVSAQGPLGVDIEHIRANTDQERIAARYFAPDECAQAVGAGHFFRVWTLREAILKATGLGVAGMARLRDQTVAGRAEVEFNGTIWRMAEFEPEPGYAGALALARDH